MFFLFDEGQPVYLPLLGWCRILEVSITGAACVKALSGGTYLVGNDVEHSNPGELPSIPFSRSWVKGGDGA